MTPLRIRIITLGCKVNQCDAEAMARALAAAGYEVAPQGGADAFVVNTCTVTATADAKARKLIRKLSREHPGAPVVVTGCWAQRDAEQVAQVEGVSAVVGNDGKAGRDDAASALKYRSNKEAGVVKVIRQLLGAAIEEDGTAAALNHRSGESDRNGVILRCAQDERESNRRAWERVSYKTRVFVKVQDGCDHRCAYCAVPDARGGPESRVLDDVLWELRGIAEMGTQEAVLCGIRLGAYGKERARGETLARLLREMRGLGIPRVRLSSIEPMDVSDELIAEMADHPRLCHHLHLPLQSGDDGVLGAMGRGYTSGGYARLVSRIRSIWPDVAITTDVMVGFPGEAGDQFERTVVFVREVGFTGLHIFPFSPRAGTPAAERPDRVQEAVKRGRAERLIAAGKELAHDAALRCVGGDVRVLFEQEKGGRLTGLTEHYRRAWCAGPRKWVGGIVTVKVEGVEGGELICDTGCRSGGKRRSGARS